MTVRFGLRDVMMAMVAVGGMIGTFRLSDDGFHRISVLLLPAAVSWHLVRNDWRSCVLAGCVGSLANYIYVLFVGLRVTVIVESLREETLILAGVEGFTWGFVVGLVTRTILHAAEGLLAKPVGLGGPSKVLMWIAIGYSVMFAGLLSAELGVWYSPWW
jgi:hypothetical protein